MLIALQPEAFQRCFRDWVADALEPDEGGPARLVAIDGKTCRRSHDAAHGFGPLHIVSAWASEHGIAVGQVDTEEKSNEITAIPLLLKQIELDKALITIDAMGCQKDIARDILACGGDFVIAVKDSQPKLAESIGSPVGKHLDGASEALRHRSYETDEHGPGRRDERFYFVAQVPPDFASKEEWPWIKAIGTAVRITTHADGRQSDEVRYYMLSRFLSGKRFGEAVRNHWSIESMHWDYATQAVDRGWIDSDRQPPTPSLNDALVPKQFVESRRIKSLNDHRPIVSLEANSRAITTGRCDIAHCPGNTISVNPEGLGRDHRHRECVQRDAQAMTKSFNERFLLSPAGKKGVGSFGRWKS